MKNFSWLTDKVLSHPAWAGVASIVAVVALLVSVMQLNDKSSKFEIEASNIVQPKWISQLRHNPIRPGIGMAGLKIGDPEQNIQTMLGIATRDSSHVIGGDGEIYLDDRKGRVLHYSTMYESEDVFLGIYTDADSKLITSFRLSDKSFNAEGILPSFNGITIGSTSDLVSKQFGDPLSKDEHMSCPYKSNKEPNNFEVNAITYYYSGIKFWICTENDLVYLIDIKPNNAN